MTKWTAALDPEGSAGCGCDDLETIWNPEGAISNPRKLDVFKHCAFAETS